MKHSDIIAKLKSLGNTPPELIHVIANQQVELAACKQAITKLFGHHIELTSVLMAVTDYLKMQSPGLEALTRGIQANKSAYEPVMSEPASTEEVVTPSGSKLS